MCHRITRSARASTCGGIVTPICLAAFRLITSSNFVGCSTGSSAGLAPFRIFVDIGGGATEGIRLARTVGHKASGIRVLSLPIHSGQPVCHKGNRIYTGIFCGVGLLSVAIRLQESIRFDSEEADYSRTTCPGSLLLPSGSSRTSLQSRRPLGLYFPRFSGCFRLLNRYKPDS